MRTLWLVTARSGSQTIPDKNVRELGGHPLLAYRIAAALKLARTSDVWLSTDSRRYAEIGRRYGVTVPFLRPAGLASDQALSVDVVMHALEFAHAQDQHYDAVGVLEPTSPFVAPSTLTHAHERLATTAGAEAIVATRLVRPSTFYVQRDTRYLEELGRRLRDGVLRRQDEPVEITPSGGFYLARTKSFADLRSFYTERTLSHRVGLFEALEIDDLLDWEWAEFLVSSGRVRAETFGLVDARESTTECA